MAEDYLALTEEKERSYKLGYLIVKGGKIVLKYSFDILTSTRKNFLQEEKPKLLRLASTNILTKAQKSLLYPSPGPSSGPSPSDEYDLTLLVALHRTCLCTKKENDAIWRFGNTPKLNDHSVEADIVRLRDSRNELFHQSMPEMTEAEFNTKWHTICQVLLRLGNGIPNLKDALEKLRYECFDKESEQFLLKNMEELFEQDKTFGDDMIKTVLSYSPCGNILEQTRRSLSNVLDDSFFVETYPFTEAKRILNEKWIVFLIGPMGSGKSTNGIKLVEDVHKCLKINKISDWDTLNTDKVDTVFIDDIFGDVRFDKDDSIKWPIIIQKIAHDVQTKRHKFIVTSRTYIWKEALQSMNVSNLIDDSNTVTMSSMTNEDMTDILKKHVQMNGRTLSNEKVIQCIDAANKRSSFFAGFAECARLFCQCNDLFDQEHTFFESPFTRIKDCLLEIFKNNEKIFLAFFVLWAQKPQKLQLVQLEQTLDNTPKAILDPIEQVQFRPEDELKTIRGSLMSHIGDFILFDKRRQMFNFSHPVISDVFGLVAYEKNGTAVLKYCHASFIDRYIRIEDDRKDIAINEENECHVISLPRPRFDTLCAKIRDILLQMNGGFIKEENECIMGVVDLTKTGDANEAQIEYMNCLPLLYPVFRNKIFCEIFFKDIMKDKVVQILTKPVSKVDGQFEGFEKILDEDIRTADICFFAYLVKHSMFEFKEFLSVCYKTMSEKCSQNDNYHNALKHDLLISLLLAIKHGNLELVKFLVTLGDPVEDQNVIIAALKMANKEIITFLLQNSNLAKEISRYSTKCGRGPLLMFIEDDNVEAVKCILGLMNCCKNDIDAQNEVDANHDTVLHKACKMGQNEIVEQMLLRTPNVLARNVNGFCPIHEAAMAGKTNVVKLLLQHDRKQAEYVVNLSESMQRVKLYHIAVYLQSTDLIDVLETFNIPLDCVDDVKHQTPFLFALQQTKCHVVRKLADVSVQHGVHNMTDSAGNTALHIAIEKLTGLTDSPDSDIRPIYLEIISLLLRQSDIDITLPNKQGKSALQLAEEGNMPSIANELAHYKNLTSYIASTEGESDDTQSTHTYQEDDDPTPAKKIKQSSLIQ